MSGTEDNNAAMCCNILMTVMKMMTVAILKLSETYIHMHVLKIDFCVYFAVV